MWERILFVLGLSSLLPLEYATGQGGGNLTAQLEMNDAPWTGVSGEVIDSSGNANHGTAQNGATTIADSFRGQIGSFDGVNDYVEIDNLIDFGTSDFSVTVWVNIAAYTDKAGIFTNRSNTGDDPGFLIRTDTSSTGRKEIEILTDFGESSTQSFARHLATDRWYHVAATVDRDGSQKIYIDGALQDTDDISSFAAIAITSSQNPRIGINEESTEFQGEMEDLRLYSKVLTTLEIQDIYNTTNVGPVELVRGPYLQRASTDEMTLRWLTSFNTNDSRVRYGSSPGSLTQTATFAGAKTDHTVQITGLNPNARYYYAVGSSAGDLVGDDVDHYFETHPAVASTQPQRFWVLGDSGTGNNDTIAVRDAYLELAASEQEADMMMLLGDNAYDDGTQLQHQGAVFDMYSSILRNKVLWPTLGNHGARDFDPVTGELLGKSGPNMGFNYLNIFTLPTNGESGGVASGNENYYSYDRGTVHFICLDSNFRDGFGSDPDPSAPMAQWLQQDLTATNQDWLIVFWHHPPYSKGSHDGDSAMRDTIVPIIEAGGVDLVLSGHSHSYERSYLIDSLTSDPGLNEPVPPSAIIDSGDGQEGGDGVYEKPPGIVPNTGTVYIVAGSSGKTSGVQPGDPGSWPSPIMIHAAQELGSLVIDVNDQRMDVRFLRELTNPAQVDDFFAIEKTPSAGIPGYIAWRDGFFTPGESGSEPDDDPEKDKLTKFLEFALNLDPKANSMDQLPSATVELNPVDQENYLTFRYRRRIVFTGITYTVEACEDLQPWDSSPSTVEELPGPTPNPDGVTETVIVRVKPSLETAVITKKFVRLRVTAP